MSFLTCCYSYCDSVSYKVSLRYRVPILSCLCQCGVLLFLKLLTKFDKQFLLLWLSRSFPLSLKVVHLSYSMMSLTSWPYDFRPFYWLLAIKMKNFKPLQYLLPILPLSSLFLLLTYSWLLNWLSLCLKIM